MGNAQWMKNNVLDNLNVILNNVTYKYELICHIAFRCKNYKCVNDRSQCDKPSFTYSASQIERVILPYENNEVNFAFDRNG
jgi:hypothetical protein